MEAIKKDFLFVSFLGVELYAHWQWSLAHILSTIGIHPSLIIA